MESPAIAVTVSHSSRSILNAWYADKPTVCSSLLTQAHFEAYKNKLVYNIEFPIE